MSIQREAKIQFVMKRLKESGLDCELWHDDSLRQLACVAILAVMDFESEERTEHARRSWHELAANRNGAAV